MTEAGRIQKQRRIVIATWLSLAVVLIIQALPFTYGYRRLEDDAMFLRGLAGGWAGIKQLTVAMSVEQGRLGLLAIVPINILGSYFADTLSMRLAYVLLHSGVFALFAVYVSRLLATNIACPLLLVLVTLQPVGAVNDHMPPIAYPLQNTLPLIMLFAARLTILDAGRQGRIGGTAAWLARLGFLVALVLTEYMFLVGTAALACEYLPQWVRRLRGSSAFAMVMKVPTLVDRQFLWDAGLVVVALVSYLGYRLAFPSSYPGNVIDAAREPWRIVATTVLHVRAGTIFVRDLFDIGSIPRQVIGLAGVVGLLTAVCSFLVLCRVRAIRAPLAVIALCIVAIAYVTFPLASTAKQQAWCLDGGLCGYLDSRISYLGFGLILLCLVALALQWMPTFRAARATVVVLSGALGVLGAANYAYNVRDGLVYANDARAWSRANLLACHPDLQSPSDRRLVRMIDPEARIRFPRGSDQAHFWRGYLQLESRSRACSRDADRQHAERRLLNDSEPILAIGHTVRFSTSSAMRYLGKGWSGQETMGAWTDGTRAELAFSLPTGTESQALGLTVGFVAYIRPGAAEQTVDVHVEGRRVDTWTITRALSDGRVHQRTIPIEAGWRPGQEIEVEFRILDPRQPVADREISDGRQLGIFILSMVLEPRTP